jgi:hypothetical protein
MTTRVFPTDDGGVLVLPEAVVKHIQIHNKIGTGSVFSRALSESDIESLVKGLKVKSDQGVQFFTIKKPNVGYHLVLPMKEALKLPSASLTWVVKEEDGRRISVVAVKTTAPLKSFETDEVTIIVGPASKEFLPRDVIEEPLLMTALSEGKLMSVYTAFPGDPNVPKTSEWRGRYAVIIPTEG